MAGAFGGAERDRTADLLVANEALSQLSYSPTYGRDLVDYIHARADRKTAGSRPTIGSQTTTGEGALEGEVARAFRSS